MKPILLRLAFSLGTLGNLVLIIDHVPGTAMRLCLVLLNCGLLGLAFCTLPPADDRSPYRLERSRRTHISR